MAILPEGGEISLMQVNAKRLRPGLLMVITDGEQGAGLTRSRAFLEQDAAGVASGFFGGVGAGGSR